MPRVAGTDPGTTSLDVLVLEDGRVADQARFTPEELQANPRLAAEWLQQRGPLDLVAGPSGYGLPLVRGEGCTEAHFRLMALVRPDEHGQSQGVLGFLAVVRALCESKLPVVFLPGVIHLPSVPVHRKINRIDLGTADKVSVAALALAQHADRCVNLCVLELGSAFTACVVLQDGRIVHGVGGSSGPPGWQSCGAWDGEVAYLLSPLAKRDLFAGGIESLRESDEPAESFCEGLVQCVAGLQAVALFREIVLSGRLLERQPELVQRLRERLRMLGEVRDLESLPGAWVKHAAQGAALLADGLAGGRWSALVDRLRLREASGSVLDGLRHPRAADIAARFGYT